MKLKDLQEGDAFRTSPDGYILVKSEAANRLITAINPLGQTLWFPEEKDIIPVPKN